MKPEFPKVIGFPGRKQESAFLCSADFFVDGTRTCSKIELICENNEAIQSYRNPRLIPFAFLDRCTIRNIDSDMMAGTQKDVASIEIVIGFQIFAVSERLEEPCIQKD